MEHSLEEWDRLQTKVAQLEIENQRLRQEIARMSDPRPNHGRQRASLPAQTANSNVREPSKKELVSSFQQWSLRASQIISLIQPIPRNIEDENCSHRVHEQVPKEAMAEPSKVSRFSQAMTTIRLIEDICLFGPKEFEIRDSKERKFRTKHALYLSSSESSFAVYGNYLYPDDVPVKRMRNRNFGVEVDRIIFKKRFKQQDCSIFIFQALQGLPSDVTNTAFVKQINPARLLYAIVIEFSDYIYSKDVVNLEHDEMDSVDEERRKGTPSDISGDQRLFKSTFSLCVFTYLPFVNFLTDLLINLIDEVKIKRMEAYTKSTQNFQKLDIQYFVSCLEPLVQTVRKQTATFEPVHNAQLQLIVGMETLSLDLRPESIWSQLYGTWAYRILKLFERDTLYEIYTNILLQESVLFVCENIHILTFAIMLFTSMLTRPYYYPYPCVSLVFNEELLETPFTAVLGLAKSSQWLEENPRLLEGSKDNKIVVDLNELEVRCRAKRKVKAIKSERLRKIISNFYKRAEKMEGNSSLRGKEAVFREVSVQENELMVGLLKELLGFHHDQVDWCLPDCSIIETIKQSLHAESATSRASILIRSVEKFMGQSKRERSKDPFVEAFIQKQIFYVYINTKYDIA